MPTQLWLLQAIALLGKAQLCASLGSMTEAEACLAEAAPLLGTVPLDFWSELRMHHWLLSTMLQLGKGETLALQQTGEPAGLTWALGHTESTECI